MNFNNLLKSIFDYDPDGPNIHHLLSVHEYSVLIAQLENICWNRCLLSQRGEYDNSSKIFGC